jgi:metal-responsive CopG/Arc/MetJ family transcriptional regulator
MPVKKLAISVPEDVIRAVDRAAAARRVTRSRFISDTLRVIAGARTDAEIRVRVDRVMADLDVPAEQRDTARAFQRAGSRRGTEW